MPNRTVYISTDNEAAWEKFKTQYGSLNNFLSMESSSMVERGTVNAVVAGSTPASPASSSSSNGRTSGFGPDNLGSTPGEEAISPVEIEFDKEKLKKLPPRGKIDPDSLMDAVKLSGQKFCKNGHPIPDGRVKCLGKGCKYS